MRMTVCIVSVPVIPSELNSYPDRSDPGFYPEPSDRRSFQQTWEKTDGHKCWTEDAIRLTAYVPLGSTKKTDSYSNRKNNGNTNVIGKNKSSKLLY